MNLESALKVIGALSALGLLLVTCRQYDRAEYWQKLDRSKVACAAYVEDLDAFVLAADKQRNDLEVLGISGADATVQLELTLEQIEATNSAERSFLRAFGERPPARLQRLKGDLYEAALLRRYTSYERGNVPLPDYEVASAKFLSACIKLNVKG